MADLASRPTVALSSFHCTHLDSSVMVMILVLVDTVVMMDWDLNSILYVALLALGISFLKV